MGAPGEGAALYGRVVEFDEPVGLGVVAVDGGDRFVFHCVDIIDGTRTIEVGTRVGFRSRRRLGALEAVHLTAI